jgi:hypothetical protein
VEGDLSASAAPGVGLGMSLTERLCSLSLLFVGALQILVSKENGDECDGWETGGHMT